MKKFLLILLILLVAGYIYWPYYTVGSLENALRLADRQSLEKLIDFPAVRESIKAQVAKSSPVARQPAAAGLQHDMLAGAGLLANQLTGPMIDAMFTPESLTKMLQAARAMNKTEPTFDLSRPSWTGINTCSVEGGGGLRLNLRLAGLDGWRVVGVETEGNSAPQIPKPPGAK